MRIAPLLFLTLVASRPVMGQHAGRAPTPGAAAPREATQFDFLVGQWELTVTPKVSSLAARLHGAPRLLGTWKAWRALDGYGIEDELRVVDRSGNPSTLSLNIRAWSSTENRWVMTAVDAYRGRVSTSQGAWGNGEMVVNGQGSDPEGKPVVTRSRFTAITPTAFRFVQDRSSDGGRTWDEKALVIEARRVAAVAPR